MGANDKGGGGWTNVRSSGRFRRREMASRIVGLTSRWTSRPICRNSFDVQRRIFSKPCSR